MPFKPISAGDGYTQNMGQITDQLRELQVPTLRIAKTLDGTKNPAFTHIITSGDATSNNFVISFAHGLGFIPSVSGGYLNSFDSKVRQLPYTGYNTASNYFGSFQDYHVQVDSVDAANVTIRVVMHTIAGQTAMPALATLTFILYLLSQKIQ